MAPHRHCDIAIVGGGLSGGLIALFLAQLRPDARVLLVEAGDRLGGEHVWSYFDSDLDRADRAIVAPLAAHSWAGYDIAFPGHARALDASYSSITSERFDAVLRARLPAERIVTNARVLGVGATALVLANGMRVEAHGVIDARGAADLALLDLGWQKFVGRELLLDRPHGLTRPVVMDATVDQIDGYRFVYLLPFGPTRLFVEDTYYSDTPDLDVARITARIDAYAAQRGWAVRGQGRVEQGVLPVAMGGDFEAYWRSGGNNVAKAGVRAGLFHPTTGYSLPDAVRTARFVAELPDWSGAALHTALHDRAAGLWRERGFYRLLDRMLFRAAEPARRYKVLERFYRLDERLVRRFYAGNSTLSDKLRIVAGRPPVPIGRALRALVAPKKEMA